MIYEGGYFEGDIRARAIGKPSQLLQCCTAWCDLWDHGAHP